MSASNPLSALVENMVHEPTQVHDTGIDLTVSVVYRVTDPGALDFGGDELSDATLEPVESTPRVEGDTYEWWSLEAGQYVVQYNEFLTGEADSTLFVQPRNELLARGGSHPSVRVDSHLPLLPLSVPTGGIELKENARISTLVSLDRSAAEPPSE
ncbi:dCTP deaminase [Halovivax gelatinilyticus]|uniref:dCTP deaminase n=1 Tax=Halovivax gelatinilyticus TaxID=2961597 RepID=UPI0020CA3C0C|nr:dCTP deaminase [Halovivax gelatinilyticus]